MIPPRRMESQAGEGLPPGNVGIVRYPQHPCRGDHHVERLFAECCAETPLPVVVFGSGDVATEADVTSHTTLVGHPPEVRLYFRTRRQQPRPLRVGRKRIAVEPRRNITGET